MKFINYSIGEEYLKDWEISEALREIYQNFLDYGEFTENISEFSDKVYVSIHNSYESDTLEFLKIGTSVKKEGSIGKHGEGLKMACLVFLRNGLAITIKTRDYKIKPEFVSNNFIGKTMALLIFERPLDCSKGFSISFVCNKEIFKIFRENIITQKDIIFKDNYHGSKVNKPKGNLYSGGLFVTNLKNLSASFDISPERLHLDRDRRIPGSFEVSYHTSKINEAEGRFNFVDQEYDDNKYVTIPKSKFNSVRPINVEGKVEFVAKVTNEVSNKDEEILITNDNFKQQLKESNFFKDAINRIKSFIVSKLGIKDLLIEFRDKHCRSDEAKMDFDLLLKKLNISIE